MHALLPAVAVFAVLYVLPPGSAAHAEVVAPPDKYDHSHPSLVVVEREYFSIDPTCRAQFPRTRFPAATDTHRITGCADIGNGRRPCRIFVPMRSEGRISEEKRQLIVRHERAHCNGWPASHPRS